MNFSRQTIIEGLTYFEGWSTNEYDRLLLKYSLEDIAPEKLGSKPKRINILMKYLINNPTLLGVKGSNLTLEVFEEILEEVKKGNYSYRSIDWQTEVPKFFNSLSLDGFSINDSGNIITNFPQNLVVAEKHSELEELLSRNNFNVAQGHLEQALKAHTRGDWAATNSQLRPFVESIFDTIADKLLTPPLPLSSHQKKEALVRLNPPFIDPALNEWDNSGRGGFVQEFWRRLHPSGSHPGLSDEEDSTFRLQIVIILAHHFMKRFERYVSSYA